MLHALKGGPEVIVWQNRGGTNLAVPMYIRMMYHTVRYACTIRTKSDQLGVSGTNVFGLKKNLSVMEPLLVMDIAISMKTIDELGSVKIHSSPWPFILEVKDFQRSALTVGFG